MTHQTASETTFPFSLKNGSVTSTHEATPTDFLAAEVQVIESRIRTIASKLKHDGPVKILHRDHNSVIAAEFGDEIRGRYLTAPSNSDGDILSSL